MITCKYCGTKLDFIGQYKTKAYFYCDFCDMNFDHKDVCEDRKRKVSVPDYYDTQYYKSTPKLLKHNTVELFHMLRDCRKDWYDTNKTLSNLKKVLKDPEHEQNTKESQKIYDSLFIQYEGLTKQKFVIENVLLEKAGFLPDKLTDDFLGDLVDQGERSSKKPMHIYISCK